MPFTTGYVTTGMVAGEHLSMHREYLDGQLRVADRLSGVLLEETGRGGPSENVVAGITAVTQHSLAIGRATSRPARYCAASPSWRAASRWATATP